MSIKKGLASDRIKEIKKRAKNIKATVRIGKNGLSSGLIEEITKQVKKKGLVKVKMLKSAFEHETKESIIRKIEKESKAKAILSIGFSVSFYKTPAVKTMKKEETKKKALKTKKP